MPLISLRSTYVLRTVAVFIAVSICTAVLFTLKPWPEHAGSAASSPEDETPATAELVSGVTEISRREIVPAGGRTAAATSEEPSPSASQAAQDAKADGTDKAGVEETAAASLAEADAALAEESAPDPAPVQLAARSPDDDPGPLTTQATPQRPAAKLSKAEADKALKPLLDASIPDSELDALKAYARRIYRDDYDEAKPYLKKIKDPVAKKLALWYYYRAGGPDASADEIAAFRAANPLWPSRDKLAERAEEALFWREDDPRKIAAYFRGRPPETATGRAALGGTFLKLGKTGEGRRLIRRAWREARFTPAIEARIKERHGGALRAEDHKARIDYLLMQDSKSLLPTVERLLPHIDKKWQTQVKACMAAVKRSKKAADKLAKLDPAVRDQPVVLFLRARAARRADKDKEAWNLLRSAPPAGDSEKLVDPERWWSQREALVRTALNTGNPKSAYTIVKDHPTALPPEDISEAEFLSGWIALRFLDRPKAARRHFMASAAAGGLPYRRARAAYWGGRAELVLGNRRAATARFAEAAQHSHNFYGQLAHQMIDAKDAKLTLRTYVRPTAREIADFVKLDVMRAMVIAEKADLDSVVAIFLFDLARNITSAADMTLAAELATRVTRPNVAVRMAKIALNRGYPTEHYAYPDALPDYKPLSKEQNLEAALVSAVTRQESEFHQGTVSSAGAVGLMQVLPSTGKETARMLSVKFEKKKLKSDPAYNVSLGTAYLHRLMVSYDGSYIMTLAGYNAGPGRVRNWSEQFGDPRSRKVDPIDWIERIPFTETRRYVHKIMESAQVYRSRLRDGRARLRLAQDLYRGRKDQPKFMLSLADGRD